MKIHLDYEFDDWNTYIKKERSNKYWANNTKKNQENIIKMMTIGKKYEGNYPIEIIFNKYFKDKRRDLDGVNLKIIIDGLVRSKVIQNDNLNYIQKISIIPTFSKEKKGIDIFIREIKK